MHVKTKRSEAESEADGIRDVLKESKIETFSHSTDAKTFDRGTTEATMKIRL